MTYRIKANGFEVGVDESNCVVIERHYPNRPSVSLTVTNVAELCEALHAAKEFQEQASL
jgi:hypothetical protein